RTPPVARDARLGSRLLAEQQVLAPPLEEQHSFSDTLVSHPNAKAQPPGRREGPPRLGKPNCRPGRLQRLCSALFIPDPAPDPSLSSVPHRGNSPLAS